VPMKPINLEWTPLEDASAYRLTFRDDETGDLVHRTEPFTEPRFAFDPSVAEGRKVYARLEVSRNGEDEDAWEEFGPSAPVPTEEPDEDATLLRWEGVSPHHRLEISDQTSGRKVLDQVVLGTTFSYAPAPAERGHDLVMRVRGWRDDDWEEWTDWQPLPLRVMLGEEREPPPPIATDTDAGLLLVFTIDTEGFLARQLDPNPATTVDELIFGDFGNGEGNGIGLHMDLLEHFGYRGCFFVDVLSAYQYGEDNLKRAVEAIMERGHEVELHVHDEHLRNSDDPAIRALAGDLMAKDRDGFRDILALGVETFERLTGRQPIAYRAGGYRITDEHFPALEELGIKIDSSVNAYLNSRVDEWMRTRTQPYWIGDILEAPPSWTLVRDDRAAQETRAFAPNATAGDPVSTMPSSSTGVPRVATYVSHSSELMFSDRELSGEGLKAWERNVRDRVPEGIAEKAVQAVTANPRLVNGTVNEELVYRVAGLIRRIADRDDARCVTYSELREIADRFPRDRRREPVDPVPAIDRPHGAATVTGTRVYSEALLDHLSSFDGAGRTPSPGGEDAITTLVNADVAWKGSDVAVIDEDSPDVSGWLGRRKVARVEHLDEPKGSGEFDVVAWPSGFERHSATELGDRLDAAAAMLRDGGSLVLRARTLGVAPKHERNGEPALTELLFPAAAQRSADVTAWDAATFASWFEASGFQVVAERRVARSGVEMKSLHRFADKLAAIPGQELLTGAVDFTLRRAETAAAATKAAASEAGEPGSAEAEAEAAGAELLDRFDGITPGDDVLVIAPGEIDASSSIEVEDVTVTTAAAEKLVDESLEADSCDVLICPEALEGVELERFDDASRALYRAVRPGGQLLLKVASDREGLATVTTVLVGLLRAGFEVLAIEESGAGHDLRLVRPLELAEIVDFSGIQGPSSA
jgi:hypothetical protein